MKKPSEELKKSINSFLNSKEVVEIVDTASLILGRKKPTQVSTECVKNAKKIKKVLAEIDDFLLDVSKRMKEK